MSQARRKIVCFGGGTGLSSLLSGLRESSLFDITAIVTMFDNGRSSGELRDRFGILPPGDIMKCMVALAENPQAARELLTKRIERPGRAPHSVGNMLLMGIEKVYGDYYGAIRVFSEMLSITGTVVPVSIVSSTLCSELEDGSVVTGQVAVEKAICGLVPIKRLFLEPSAPAFKVAKEAIRRADIIVVGPGSLFTSVLPNFLSTGVGEEIKKSKAPIVFICNLLTEGSAMSHKYPIEHWIRLAESYVGRRFSRIIINQAKPSAAIRAAYKEEGKYPLLYSKAIKDRRFVPADMWFDQTIARHDPASLAWAIAETAIRLKK